MLRRLTLGVLAGLAVWALAEPTAAGAAIRFGPPREFPAGGNPYAIVTGDFNGDGKADVATSNLGNATVSVVPGVGDGTLGTAVVSPVTGGFPLGLATADFNRDGHADLAVADGGSVTVLVLLGNGDGSFLAPASFPVSDQPRRVAAGDVNKDGAPDLVVTCSGQTGIVDVLFNDGTGSFGQPVAVAGGDGDGNPLLADLNGDNFPEILVPNTGSDALSVLSNNADGTFGPDRPVPVVPQPQGVASGDFNGDGRLDAAVVGSSSPNASVLLGDGLGGFAPRVDYPSGLPVAYRIRAADFDGDQRTDLAVAFGQLGTMAGAGDGTFAPGVVQPGGSNLDISAVDLNGDALPDIASGLGAQDAVTVSLNTSGPDSALPPPQVAQTANVVPESGIVLVKRPGRRGFVRLKAGQQIPIGSFIDTSKGSVRLTTAANATGATQTGLFKKGLFKLGQKRGAQPITDLKLAGPKFRCRSGRGPVRLVRKRARSRQLFGNAQGRFRTRGRNSTATVRGTQWLVKDTCAGTRTRVRKGTVLVRDLVKRRNVTLHAGQSYLARAR